MHQDGRANAAWCLGREASVTFTSIFCSSLCCLLTCWHVHKNHIPLCLVGTTPERTERQTNRNHRLYTDLNQSLPQTKGNKERTPKKERTNIHFYSNLKVILKEGGSEPHESQDICRKKNTKSMVIKIMWNNTKSILLFKKWD